MQVQMDEVARRGFEVVEERWEPAGTVQIGSGKYAIDAFPNLPADQLVCVERKVSMAVPDRAAGQYLIDRIAGKRVQKVAPTDPSNMPRTPSSVIQGGCLWTTAPFA
jgi:hypothetical protein